MTYSHLPIYMDHAATSWPKPAAVKSAMVSALDEGGNPGRSGHRFSLSAARRVLAAREAVAELLGVSDPARIALAANATAAVNLAIFGLVNPGDHVVTTAIEHNSVMRPLRHLAESGVSLTVLPCSPEGYVDPDDVRRALRQRTKLLVTTHASNVLGTIQPIATFGQLAREAGALYLVDAAQTAGALPIHLAQLPVDLLAFTGHKALLGPQGTGGLYIREGLDLAPQILGGTGSASEREVQPEFLPDRFESGTPNVPGLAGLAAGARHLLTEGVAAVRAREEGLTARFLQGLQEIHGMVWHGPVEAAARTPLVSLNLQGLDCATLAQSLEDDYGIMTRPGLHCAPAAHRVAGTWPTGSVRFSFGWGNTAGDVDAAVDALAAIAGTMRRR